jgi:hypothetical protein
VLLRLLILIAGSIKPFASGIADMTKPFWEKDAPTDAKKRNMSRQQVKAAKAKARSAGRPYPNLIDNVTALRAGKKDR